MDKNLSITSLPSMGTNDFVTWPIITVASRFESIKPSDYRLAKKLDGTLILQGYYAWQEGTLNGGDWKEIPTVYIIDYEELAKK